MCGIWPFGVVVRDPFSNPTACFQTSFKCIEVNALIFQEPPQAFDHAIVTPRAFAIHADLDLCIREHVDPSTTGKLAALVRIKYLWPAVLCQRFFQGFNAEVRVHAVGQPPSKDFATVPIQYRH